MKGVLVDENLPAGLRLPTELPTFHVTQISASPSDTLIWEYAKEHALVVLTKDADFSLRMLSCAPPPWIVHVRLGNVRLRPFLQRLTSVWPTVESLLPNHKLISIYPNSLETIR